MTNPIGFIKNVQNEETKKSPLMTQYDQKTTIFGQNTFLPINYNQALNDNTLVIGTSGTGKTYSFVKPNILQGNSNYVVADAKGNILAETGNSLRRMGYHLQVLNLVDLKHSMTYNPLAYMNSEIDVISFANQILEMSVSGNVVKDTHQDPFWNKAAASLISALIFFVNENLPEREQTMGTVVQLFNIIKMEPDNINLALSSLGDSASGYSFSDYNSSNENDDRTIGSYLFEWVEKQNPSSMALKMWREVTASQRSEKTWSSILGIVSAALMPYSLTDVENLLSSNQINFTKLLEPKNALFIIYDDADASKNFISNTLYSQLIKFLYHHAFICEGNRLDTKVRFFLDDFKNVKIPGFDDYLATARSRNISFCMMLQDESQLRAKFGENTNSVIGNCSAYLLTGTTDLNMAETASKRFSLSTQEIRLMDAEHFLLDVGGNIVRPLRYDFHDHPNYDERFLNVTEAYSTPSLRCECNDWLGLCNILKNLPHETNDGFDDLNDVLNMF